MGEFSEQITHLLQASGLSVIPEQLAKLEEYAILLKNSHLKSSASWGSDERGLQIHFEDSFYTFPDIKPKKFLDIGSGSGVPGIIYAILWPDSEAFLLESQQKRCNLMEIFIQSLGLQKRVNVLKGRAEALAHDRRYREFFPLVTGRAFAQFPAFIEYSVAFAKVNGYVHLIRGYRDRNALKDWQHFLDHFSLERVWEKQYQIKDSKRWTAVYQKKRKTLNQYPRKNQQIGTSLKSANNCSF